MLRPLGIVLCLMTGLGAPASAAETVDFQVVVNVQDYTTGPDWSLHAAQAATGRVFGEIGIAIRWKQPGLPPEDDQGVPTCSIVVLSSAMVAAKTKREHLEVPRCWRPRARQRDGRTCFTIAS